MGRKSSFIEVVKRHAKAVVASLVLHVGLLIFLSISLSTSEVHKPASPKAQTVKAELVDTKKIEAEKKKREQEELKKQQAIAKQKKLEEEKKRQAELKKKQEAEKKKQAELKRKQEAEKKKQAELKRKKEAELKRQAELKKKQEAEKKRQAELAEKKRIEEERRKAELEKQRKAEAERKRKEEEARQKRLAEEAEKRRKAEEAELMARLAEEERRLAEHNRMLDSKRLEYVMLIRNHVTNKWLLTSTPKGNQSCEVYVRQTMDGTVTDVRLQACSGDFAFQQSVEQAVRRASPLPSPPHPEVFEREIRFIFSPGS